jgi:hypothetical protein
MADHEQGRLVRQSRRTVEQLIEEWLYRRQHSVKQSMHANYRDYAHYYIYPYIGRRKAQDLDSVAFDALYAKLLTAGRVKANSEHGQQREARKAAHEQAIADRIAGNRRGPAPMRVVIDSKVIEEDGKSDNSRRTIALDPYTLGVLRSPVNMLDAECAVHGEHYEDHGLLFCWKTSDRHTRIHHCPLQPVG